MSGNNRFIYILFCLAVVLLGWLGYTYFSQNKAQLKYTDAVEHTYQVIITAQYCENLLLDAETKQHGYLLTRDPHFRNSSDASASKIDSALNLLRKITLDNAKQRVNIHLLKTAIQERLLILKQNFNLPASEKQRVYRLTKGQMVMDKIHVYIRMIEDEERALLIERDNAKNHYQTLNFTFAKYTFLFACILCGVAVLLIIYELRKRIKAQKLLEKTILDLKRSNEEVEQITFTASHDLQEPLRKIRTLGTLFTRKYESKLADTEKDILDRIDKATEKMQLLINDLVDFTTLLNTSEQPEMVNLTILFTEVFEKLPKEGNKIKLNMYHTLPTIHGYKPQLEILFTQLLDNAVKYKDPHRPLAINVTYRMTAAANIRDILRDKHITRYHQITFSDNGIGFDNIFKEKIFILFQRLHRQDEYTGKGTGLALVKRIMTNHYGYIEANGEKDVGASFSMYFPVN
jgi:signal transduction histidine kinase